MAEDTYNEFIYCSNCKIRVRVPIPKGTTVEAFVKTQPKCPRCGNKGRLHQD